MNSGISHFESYRQVLLNLDIHNNGILSTSWCPYDPKIIASSSRDGKTCFFDSENGHLIAQIDNGIMLKSLQWSPFAKGKLIGFDEDKDLIEIFDFNKAQKGMIYTPKWMIKPCGHAIGFGGKIARFSRAKGLDIIQNIGGNKQIV